MKLNITIDRSIIRQLITVALPLTIASTGTLILQLADAFFLARYSPDALAAMGPSGIFSWLYVSLFNGTIGYSTALVAQAYGRKEYPRIGALVWQGMYLALACSAVLIACVPWAMQLFRLMGHEPGILAMEKDYFRILAYGYPLGLVNMALTGFYAGRGETRPIMVVQLIRICVNILFDWLLIFGEWGFPRVGIAGAAYATIVAEAVSVSLMASLVFQKKWRSEFALHAVPPAWRDWRLYFVFGLPSGVRVFFETMAWTAFVFFVGRVSATAVAATSVVFRLNTLTFFPILGMGEAIKVLVGQATGRRASGYAERIIWHGFGISEVWMLLCAVMFLLIPRTLFGFFAPSGVEESVVRFADVSALGVVLLRYVVVYSLVDSANVALAMGLQGAGDTQWSMKWSLVLHASMITALFMGDTVYPKVMAALFDVCVHPNVHTTWIIGTVFTFISAAAWIWRLRHGGWRNVVVLD